MEAQQWNKLLDTKHRCFQWRRDCWDRGEMHHPWRHRRRSGIREIVQLQGEQSSVATVLDLDQGVNKGIGVALVSKQKQLVLLHLEGEAATNNGQLLHPAENKKSKWMPFTEKIIQTSTTNKVVVQKLDHFLVASISINKEFILAFILNTTPYIETFLLAGAGVVIANLIALTVSTVVLIKISKPLLSNPSILQERRCDR